MIEFITPIVNVTRKKAKKEIIPFYTLVEYEKWKTTVEIDKWDIKYYKGLGTSTAEEAQEYFQDLPKHRKLFEYTGKEDDDLINMAFTVLADDSDATQKLKAADKRKEWINSYVAGSFLDQSKKKIPYKDFINKELVLFSVEACKRAIPSVVDGLKPGQRKILYAAFKKPLKKETKVSQFSGYVSEHSAYHHGEASLQSTIINMAQNFVGSNNINLFHPQGQFGTRLEGGKDAASPRYITTFLSGLSRLVFHPQDDEILNYLEEDGDSIEPEWYIPIIPLVLCNGPQGIGTGWSSRVPAYNPRDLVKNILLLLDEKEMEVMDPWYRGWKGTYTWDPKKSTYYMRGVYKKLDDQTLEITELPVELWTGPYKEKVFRKINGKGTRRGTTCNGL